VGWHLTIITRSCYSAAPVACRNQDLAAEARRLRPDVEIVIRAPVGAAYRYE
jgi:hypothetical protein